MVNIAKPPSKEYQLRVIIYKTKEVPNFDTMSDCSDLFVRSWLEDPKDKSVFDSAKKMLKKVSTWLNPFKDKAKAARKLEKAKAEEPQESDTHWRCRNGKGSWNWRIKINISLPRAFPYLHLQLWDRDIFKWNDCIAETNLNCATNFIRAHRNEEVVNFFKKRPSKKERRMAKNPKKIDPKKIPKKSEQDIGKEEAKHSVNMVYGYLGLNDPADSDWLSMYKHDFENDKREYMGKILVAMEVLPMHVAQSRPAGFGRSEPNMNPFLPRPVGRFRFSWNPIYMLLECLGPKMCFRCACCLVCVGITLLMVFGGPFINLVLTTLSPYFGEAWFWLLVVLSCDFCSCCCAAMELHAKYMEHVKDMQEQAEDANEATKRLISSNLAEDEEEAARDSDESGKDSDMSGDDSDDSGAEMDKDHHEEQDRAPRTNDTIDSATKDGGIEMSKQKGKSEDKESLLGSMS